MVIVMLAVMPGRTVFGAPWMEIVTGNDTTLPPEEALEAFGAMARDRPREGRRPTALMLTVAAWPTVICGMSLSTTSAVTCRPDASMTIASPDGACSPLVTFTAVTTPSIGALRVAASNLRLDRLAVVGRVRVPASGRCTGRSCAWRIWSVARGVGVGVLGGLELDPGDPPALVASVELVLQVARGGDGHDVAGLDGRPDRDLDLGHVPGGAPARGVGARGCRRDAPALPKVRP